MTALEVELWCAIALCAALVAAIVACWVYEAVDLWCAIFLCAALLAIIAVCWAYEAVINRKRNQCQPDCPRLPGGCIGRIGGKCAARKENK